MITININPVAFLNVRWYGIFIALAIIVLVLWMAWQIKKGAKISYDTLFTAAIVGIPSGIVFSRLLHVIDFWDYYRQYPGQIIGGSGLSAYGAVLGAALGIWIYSRFSHFRFGYLAGDEPCCGGPLYYFGLHSRFEKHAREAYDKLKDHGVKRIISIIPSCTNTLRNTMPDCLGKHDIEVRHFTEVVAEQISSLNLRFPREVKVAYHDPCQLVRYMGIADEPRQILSAIKGIELVEPAWTKRDYATCCGGGAGFEAVFPELSQILAVNRAKELVETGAQIIVTQCPGCVMQLKTGLKELGAATVEVLDLAQILAMSLDS